MLLSPQILIPTRAEVVAAGGVAATTWNPSDKTSGLTLSNSNRTVSHAAGGNTNEGIRSIAFTTTNQKVYIGHVINAITTNWNCGFAVIGASLSSGPNLVNASPTLVFGVSVGSGGGGFVNADSPDHTIGVIPATTVGDRIDIAYDTGSQKAWFRKNGGTWNVSNGGGDPVAGTGGMTVVLTGSPFYAWVGLDANNGDQLTTNFASTDWVDSAPSGYTQLA